MKLGTIAAALTSVVIGLPIGIILFLGGGDDCGLGGGAPAPSSAAQGGIPANYLALYQQAGAKYQLPWTLLAGIGSVETDHGRSTAAGVRSGVNFAGCCAGPMQFSIIGAGGGTWGAYGVDGNHDGRQDVYDPRDAIPGAANYLKASGAPGDLHAAIFAYNHSEAYIQQVLAKMREYAASIPSAGAPAGTIGASTSPTGPGTNPAAGGAPAGGCDDLGGLAGSGDGAFSVAPGANFANKPLTSALLAFVARMATFYSGHLVITTGTNHSALTTDGLPSDHATGNAADFGMVLNHGTNDGPVGDQIAAAAWMAAGFPRDQALQKAQAGGLQTIYSNSLRIQIIWKAAGHHDHVHVGIASAR